MKFSVKKMSVIAMATMTLACTATADNTSTYVAEYMANIPAGIVTPDSVDTKYAGKLAFFDSFPTDETIEKADDFKDTARAFELFQSGMATASMCAMLKGHGDIGAVPNKTVAITEALMDAKSLWFTPNITTPYAHAEVNVKNGPVVIEVGSPVISILDDAYFLYVADVGTLPPNSPGKLL